MKKSLATFAGGITLLILFTLGCSKRTETVLPYDGGAVQITPCTIPLSGSVIRNGSGDVNTNADTIFTVNASGCSGRYTVYVNGQSTINFTGSSTVYTQRYTVAQSAKVEAVTIVDQADTSKSIVVYSASFNVVASGGTTGGCSIVASPNFYNVNLDANGNIAGSYPQIQVQVRENASSSIILAELKDEVSGRSPSNWITSDTAMSSLQQIQITPSVPGNHVLTATYRTSVNGAIAGSCQAYYELRANASASSCIITAAPNEVDIGQNIVFTLSSPTTVREAWIDNFQVSGGSSQVQVRAANPGDFYVQGRVVDTNGIARTCYAPYTVKAPRINTFTMNGAQVDSVTVKSTQPVLVQWTSQNADSCVVTPGGASGVNGQFTIQNLPANQTSFYTLVCTKGANQASKTFSVNVPPQVAVYQNTPSQRCNWGQVPSQTGAPIYFAYCDYTYRDNCNGSNPQINGNIQAEIAAGTCSQLSCTSTATSSGLKYGHYRCQGTSVFLRYE